jgi:hypothetical protein
MALTIYYSNGSHDEISVQSLSKVSTLLVSDVVRIYAHGHEALACINANRKIHGELPMFYEEDKFRRDHKIPEINHSLGYSVQFYGDLARTILLNL